MSGDTKDEEPGSFERVGPFIIDYPRCYAGFGTAVRHKGIEVIVICREHADLVRLVEESLGAEIVAGFHRVIVAPESKAKPLTACEPQLHDDGN